MSALEYVLVGLIAAKACALLVVGWAVIKRETYQRKGDN